MKKTLLFLCMAGLLTTSLCYAAGEVNMKPKTPEEWRAYLNFRREETLGQLYSLRPEARQVIDRAEGYAVFINFSLKIFIAGAGNGRGIVHDNKTGKDIYMRMFQANAGFGVGGKDFRAIFIFDDRTAMENFISSGWSFGTEADAAAKAGEEGAATSGAIRIAPGIRVYQLTENGLALEANVTGTKYWKDEAVNPK